MSQQSQPTDTGGQSQQTMQNGQQALQQAIEYPMRQAVEFQRSAAQIFLNGLEMQDWAQQQGIQMTRTMLDNYLKTVERAGEGAIRLPQEMAQQAQHGMQEGQQLAQQGIQETQRMAQQAQPPQTQQQIPQQRVPQQAPEQQIPQQPAPQQQPQGAQQQQYQPQPAVQQQPQTGQIPPEQFQEEQAQGGQPQQRQGEGERQVAEPTQE